MMPGRDHRFRIFMQPKSIHRTRSEPGKRRAATDRRHVAANRSCRACLCWPFDHLTVALNLPIPKYAVAKNNSGASEGPADLGLGDIAHRTAGPEEWVFKPKLILCACG